MAIAPMSIVGDVWGIGPMFAHPFMRHAFTAGTAIAAVSGLVGYFVVLRAQVFAGDALSHVAFTGALAALAAGVDARLGLFVGVVAISLLLGALGDVGRADDVTIGAVFAWILGLGVLFLSIFTSSHATGDSTAGVKILFGSIFGLDGAHARTAVLVATGVCVVLLSMVRPLLFSSVDSAVAQAKGVPARPIAYLFLVLIGVTAGEATQAVGALLLLGLLAAPAATAQRLTARPFLGLALSGAIAVVATWCGLVFSYAVPSVPPSFAIIATLTAAYACVALLTSLAGSKRTLVV
jgi:zinc/manganese transport system permease protein